MTVGAENMRKAIDAEMPHHVRRWRRPLTYGAWRAHVEDLLTFARIRGQFVRTQLEAHIPPEQQR